MIEVLSPANSLECRHELTEMFRLRHRVFCERLGWAVASINGLERDAFDDFNPTYLLAWTDHRVLAGTWRLLPTTGSYMLRSVFSHLLEGRDPPQSGDLWETSRFAVDRSLARNLGAHGVRRVTGELFCGLVEFCLGAGVREVVQVYDKRIARLLPRVGCQPVWQSREHLIGDFPAIAGQFVTDRSALQRIRDATGIREPVLVTEPEDITATAA